ncbi:hypothetical protein PV328_002853 [Microctonus aethiopoides]|uniref:Adenylate kinase n=1 Tax=Microctonus aethiopoides TaxID=144406 RepID=A0AA39F757_9HYME|nr:hypothetical protein PV328_002853 [Microctonus aethiopoides]
MGNCFINDQLGDEIPRDDESLNTSILHHINVPILFVIGGPGVGKTNIAKRLASEHGFTVITTTELIRLEVSAETCRGRFFKKIMLEGRNIPADIIVRMILRRMLLFIGTPGYLIVGFPRDKTQARLFNKKVKPPDLVIYLWARRQLLEERMRDRAIANERFDDIDEAIQNRLELFYDSTIRAISLYKSSITVIDSQRSIDEVLELCANAIERMLEKRRMLDKQNN